MEGGYDEREFWQFSDQLRLHNFSNLSIADSIWSPPLADTHSFANAGRYNYFPAPAQPTRSSLLILPASNNSTSVKSYFNKSVGNSNSNNKNVNDAAGGGKNKKNSNNNVHNGVDSKTTSCRYSMKSLPASEALPKKETIGGYIFVCNNETMEENLRRQLFGLPSRYRESVRAIRPGLPLFLYNYSTHQLHGIFEAASFGGSNIDPTAWEDSKCPGDSRFPAQVRVATRKICEPLEEDAFRPVLHHYDGPKFRLELSVTEAISLLDIFAEKLFA